MQNNQFTLDSENLKKAMPLALGIAAGLAVMNVFLDFLSGIAGILMLAGWIYIGVHFAETTIASGSKSLGLNVGLNGAILAGGSGLVYQLLSWILIGIRFTDSDNSFYLSLYFVQVAIIGGLAAFAWYVYKTNAANPK
jgi:hypothetical protein